MADNAATVLQQHGHLVIYGEVSLEAEEEAALNQWWTHEHLPERLLIPGFLAAKRYKTIDHLDGDEVSDSKGLDPGSPDCAGYTNYLVWYETNKLDVLSSEAYTTKLNEPTQGTKKFMPVISSLNRTACRTVFVCAAPQWTTLKATGGAFEGKLLIHCYSTIRKDSRPSSELLDRKLYPLLIENQSILAITILEHDETATQSGNQTSSYANVTFQEDDSSSAGEYSKWHFMIECATSTPKPDREWWLQFSSAAIGSLSDMQFLDSQMTLYSLIVAAHS